MKSTFEKQTLEKLNRVLKILEETLNNEGGYEVEIRDLNGNKIRATYDREKYLVANIESSIVSVKDLIDTIEERKRIKQQMSLLQKTAERKR